jgi:hypothetical protein
MRGCRDFQFFHRLAAASFAKARTKITDEIDEGFIGRSGSGRHSGARAHLGVSHMVEEAAATVEEVDMVEASVVAVILALAGGTAIGRKAKKPWIGTAIRGVDWVVSFGINQLGLLTHGNLQAWSVV